MYADEKLSCILLQITTSPKHNNIAENRSRKLLFYNRHQFKDEREINKGYNKKKKIKAMILLQITYSTFIKC